MATVVEYILSLKDQLSGGIAGANAKVNQLESSLGGVKSMMGSLGGMLGTLGVGFAIFKGAEFVHEGVEAFHALEQVTAKVEANLESTGEKAGLSMADITTMAKTLSSQVQFSRSEVMDMQSQLLTFPGITKEVFERSMGMVTDIAKQTNHGLSETAIMFGKAFNDPAAGLQKLMRYGVMFSQTEKDKITALQESGHLLQAQKAMLDAIAGSGYEGVAKKMFDADPLAQYNKMMGSVKLSIGEMAMGILKDLMPALNSFAKGLKESITFLGEHKALLKTLAEGVGIAAAAFLVYKGILAGYAIGLAAVSFWETIQIASLLTTAGAAGGLSIGMTILTAMQYAWNVAVTANPLGLLIIGIAAVIAAVLYCWKTFAEFRAAIIGTWDVIKEFGNIVTDIFGGIYKTIHGALHFDKDEIADGFTQQATAMFEAGQRMKKAFNNGYDGVMADDAKSKIVEGATTKKIQPKTMASVAPAEKTKADTKSKATGSKSVTINVSIKDLIGVQNINTTNLKEGAGKIKDLVVSALTGAVNDFQIVAGN